MKIGINALFMIPGQVGGAETCLRKTLEAMALAKSGHEFTVFCNRENIAVLARDMKQCGAESVCLVDTHVRATNRVERILREQLSLPGLVRRSGVDVLWSPGYTMPLRCPCPRVTSILDVQYLHHPEDFSWLALQATKYLVGAACSKSERVIAISEFVRQELVRYTDTPIDRIDVVRQGVDKRFAEAVPSDVRAERCLALVGGPEPFLLAVSNTYPHKRMELAVEAFGRIMADIPHKLVILGRPRLGEERVEKAIAALPDPGRVVRLHYVEQRDIVALYQSAECLLFPSVYEGFGLPVAEAMAAGLPVVAARAASVPEVGGDTVSLVPPGDAEALAAAVKGVITLSPEAREARVAKARERALSRFDWNETAKATLASCEIAFEDAVARYPLLTKRKSARKS